MATKKAAKAATKKSSPKAGKKQAAPVKEKAIPADVAKMVEALCKAAKARKDMEAKLAPLAEAENKLREDVEALFGRKKLDGMRHKLGTLSITRTPYPVIEDLKKVQQFAKRKGNDDILTVGVSTTALRARWDEGKAIPGVRKEERKTLRVTLTK